ncbi:MAG: DMT family transporter [Halobacteriota archaeon]|uniref:DMT family transporter n=1 Tax=Natronomonas sp. TaxID=2184060 RepID=UPI0039763CCF
MSRGRNVGLFVALATLWGLTFPAITIGLDSFPPLLFAAFRYDVAGVMLLGYLVVRGAEWMPRTQSDGLAIAIAGTFLIAGNSLLFIGQQTVPGGIASILYGLIPLLTAGFAAVLLPSEPITLRRGLGVGAGLAGVVAIAQPDPANLFTAELIGTGFVLAAAVSVAFGSVLLRRLAPTLGVGAMTAWAMLVGGGLLHLASLGIGERFADITPTLLGAISILYLAVLGSAVAYVIYFALLAEFGPLEINLVSYVVPIFATLGGIVLLDEALTSAMIVGFVLIAGGFVVIKGRVLAAEMGFRS